MTTIEEELASQSIALEQHELQHIEAGHWPEWAKRADRTTPPELGMRRTYADWCLKAVLCALLPTLPTPLRVSVQACFHLRERIWSTEYMNAYYAQKETSPASLPALDSL